MSETASPTLEVYLRLSGEFDPQNLTELIGVTPSYQRQIGAISERTKRAYLSSEWQIGTGKVMTFDMEEVVQILLDKIGLYKDVIAQVALSKDLSVSLVVVVDCTSSNKPALTLSPRQIQWLASVNAALDIDLYIVD